MSKDQCACCGAYGLPMKRVGLVMMCIDNLSCEQRKAVRRDDSDRFLLVPLEGPPDPNCPHVTVDCSRAGCRMAFFVSKIRDCRTGRFCVRITAIRR